MTAITKGMTKIINKTLMKIMITKIMDKKMQDNLKLNRANRILNSNTIIMIT